MSNYAIIIQKKIKGASAVNGLLQHNSRETNSKNVDRSRTHKNITLLDFKYDDYQDFADSKREEIRIANIERRKDGKKLARFPKPQKMKNKEGKIIGIDAALMQEYVITLSPDALDAKQREQYLRDAFSFFSKRFKNCEILYGEIHKDEKTEHLHFGVSFFDKHDKRFIQKTMSSKNITNLDEIRDAFQKEVAEKYDLKKQDGEVTKSRYDGDKAEKNKGDIRTEEKQKLNELIYTDETKNVKFFGKKKKLKVTYKDKTEELKQRIKELESKEPEVKTVEKIVEVEDTTKIKKLENQVKKLESKVAKLEKTLDTVKTMLKNLWKLVMRSTNDFMNDLSIEERENIQTTLESDEKDEKAIGYIPSTL